MPTTPEQQNAYSFIVDVLNRYGLGSLAPRVLDFVQQSYSQDTIMLELQETPEWKQRFVANETRRKKGLPVLTPAEYLSVEQSYRQIMRDAGVPSGFYDSQTDFRRFIEEDMAPAELQDRVKSAQSFIDNANPQSMALMRQYYTRGDLVAYALDPGRAAPLVGKAFQRAGIAGTANSLGVSIGWDTAGVLADTGMTGEQARPGLARVAAQERDVARLAAIDGVSVTEDEQVRAELLGDPTADRKIKKLASRERARFSGTSGVTSDSLARKTSV